MCGFMLPLMFLLGLYFAYSAVKGLQTGAIRGKYRVYRRIEDPISFWMTTVIHGFCAFFTLSIAITGRISLFIPNIYGMFCGLKQSLFQNGTGLATAFFLSTLIGGTVFWLLGKKGAPRARP